MWYNTEDEARQNCYKIERLRNPVRLAFSYGIWHVFIVIQWTVTHSLLNHNKNMPYPISARASAISVISSDILTWPKLSFCLGLKPEYISNLVSSHFPVGRRKYDFKGCGMGTLFVYISPCFREYVVVTCKIGSFLCSLDNLLQKNVIVFFLEIKFQNGAHLKNKKFLTCTFYIF